MKEADFTALAYYMAAVSEQERQHMLSRWSYQFRVCNPSTGLIQTESQ